MTPEEMVQWLEHRAMTAGACAEFHRRIGRRMKSMDDVTMSAAVDAGDSQGLMVRYLSRGERLVASDHEIRVAETWNEEAECFIAIAATLKALNDRPCGGHNADSGAKATNP